MNMIRVIHCVLFTPGPKGRWGLPTLLEGPPGSAKSSIIEQVGAAAGLHVETVIASVREPADFLGLPIPNGDRVEYMPASWAYRANKAKHAIGFLDELNTAPEAVQAALLRVVLDRYVGDLPLEAGVRMLAAQNKVEEAAGGHDLSMPLANRFIHLPWEAPDVSAWTDWVLGGEQVTEPGPHAVEMEERRVMERWDNEFAAAKGVVTSFLNARPELLHKQPEAGSPQASKAWPSRRTWEMAIRAIAGGKIHGLNEQENEVLLAGCVGTGAASEFGAYASKADLPDPTAVLDGTVKVKFDKRLDRTMAILSGCAAVIANKPSENDKAGTERWIKRGESLCKLMAEPSKTAADVCIPASRILVKNGLTASMAGKDLLNRLYAITSIPGANGRD